LFGFPTGVGAGTSIGSSTGITTGAGLLNNMNSNSISPITPSKSQGSGIGNTEGSGIGKTEGSGIGNTEGSGIGNTEGFGVGYTEGSGVGYPEGSVIKYKLNKTVCIFIINVLNEYFLSIYKMANIYLMQYVIKTTHIKLII
jgi:hypothetical protein